MIGIVINNSEVMNLNHITFIFLFKTIIIGVNCIFIQNNNNRDIFILCHNSKERLLFNSNRLKYINNVIYL